MYYSCTKFIMSHSALGTFLLQRKHHSDGKQNGINSNVSMLQNQQISITENTLPQRKQINISKNDAKKITTKFVRKKSIPTTNKQLCYIHNFHTRTRSPIVTLTVGSSSTPVVLRGCIVKSNLSK